ncbi:hypothetical protein BLNAU_6793 [Blattamonas nauphoetae]|uniref:Uncharacterized protein n=1 Tax=Blattamonas nauphoetae TaxID=2049346 RepID=A0ABQ9Y3L6_9EUKA|nr:hypothetical protein BLNAU_6793 [Blattamonas nauphoetae]
MDPKSPETLLSVHLIHRHGNRYPLQYLESFPSVVPSGQLSSNGQVLMKHIGQTVFKRYCGSLLPPTYSPGLFNFRSTQSERTRESLCYFQQGFFEHYRTSLPPGEEISKDDLSFWHVPSKLDFELRGSCAIKPAFKMMKDQSRGEYCQKLHSEHKMLISKVETSTGSKVDDKAPFNIFDSLLCNIDLGHPLPPPITTTDIPLIRYLKEQCLFFPSLTCLMISLIAALDLDIENPYPAFGSMLAIEIFTDQNHDLDNPRVRFVTCLAPTLSEPLQFSECFLRDMGNEHMTVKRMQELWRPVHDEINSGMFYTERCALDDEELKRFKNRKVTREIVPLDVGNHVRDHLQPYHCTSCHH